MRKSPSLGLVIQLSDYFFRPVETELRRHYRVSRFAAPAVSIPVVGTWANHVLTNLQLSRFLRGHDLVFFEWAGNLLVRATHMHKACAVVARIHSGEVTSTASQVDWRQVDATIAVTEFMRHRLLDVANAVPSSLHVIQNGVDLQLFRPSARTFQHRLGMACRVTTIKRVYEAILALHDIRGQGYPFTLDIAGRLDDRQEPRYPLAVQSVVKRLGLTEYVTFRGPVADMARWYHDVDIFLSNSFWESGQNALKEAMASGCYCLSHCWGGAEEVLPPAHLFATESDLCNKLVGYAALPDVEKRQAQAELRGIAEAKFDVDRMTQQIVGVIDGVLKGEGP